MDDHLGQRRLPDAVLGGESLERGAFRVVVVVDVQARVLDPAILQELDEVPRDPLLTGPVVRPRAL